jgi:hypothetical protein|tara:strand:+ start:951 stop:1571 length:621 start_codon:yes stop_codon:yes gene_type:complete
MELTTHFTSDTMPMCWQHESAEAGFELSNVHTAAGEHSFYVDICSRLPRWPSFETRPTVPTVLLAPSAPIAKEVTVDLAQAATIIDRAKRITGLSVKDLAPVFNVTRQTLYNFRKAQDTISDRNWQRLLMVDKEMDAISSLLPSSPGALAKHYTVNGDTLHGLLTAPQLDSSRIYHVASALAEQLNASQQDAVRHAMTIDELTRHA